MSVLIFEDQAVSQLAPITTSRPAYEITCAGYRLIDWLQRLDCPLTASVRSHLRPVQQADCPELMEDRDATLLVNARLVPSRKNYKTLADMLRSERPAVVRSNGALGAILLKAPKASTSIAAPWSGALDDMPAEDDSWDLDLFEFPHDVIRWNMQLLMENVEDRIARGDYQERQSGLFVGPDVRLAENVVVDTSDGPILMEQGVSVGPHSFLSGPALVGANSRLIEHSSIKDGCCIGHTAKIGGEVEASIIECFSNKQHYGFLGHSYLGSWINLGAGTCNSDLKNTYGEINMEYASGRVPTGMQFMGCVIGDYAKTAINTGIFTGKLIGVCSMVYGFVTTNVPSFVNYARLFGQVSEIPPEVLIATQQRMFRRRDVEPRECDQQLLRDMFTLTRVERQVPGPGEQLSL